MKTTGSAPADVRGQPRRVRPRTEGSLERGFQDVRLGDHVHVKPIHTDVERGFILFARDQSPS